MNGKCGICGKVIKDQGKYSYPNARIYHDRCLYRSTLKIRAKVRAFRKGK